jgi:hypothetical protein
LTELEVSGVGEELTEQIRRQHSRLRLKDVLEPSVQLQGTQVITVADNKSDEIQSTVVLLLKLK